MARNPKPIQLHLLEGNKNRLTKNEIDRRVEAEESIQFESNRLKAPDLLNDEAKKVFKQIIKEFKSSNLLVNVDIYSIAFFCDTYVTYIECTQIIEQDGLTIEGSRSAEAGVVAHPLMPKKIQLFAQMDKIMSKFGLSPVDRSKLVQSLQPKDDGKDNNSFSDRL